MKKTTINFLVFSTAGLLSGLLIGRSNIFTIFFLAIATGLVIFVFIIAKLVESYTKNGSLTTGNYMGLTALAFIVSLVTSIVTMGRIIDKKQKLAESLITKIEHYRQQRSQYPKTLDDLSISIRETFYYHTDPARQAFSIRFIRDGWHFSEYDSGTKKWSSGD
jgi:hypothetical protein